MSDPRETLAALQDHVIDRRRFLAFTGALAGTALYAQVRGDAVRAAPLKGYPFRLGIASGDPDPTAVSLWTRLAPEPLTVGGGMPRRDVAVRWELARDERFRKVERRGVVAAVPELAHSVHVDVRGLDPGREYFYRFATGPDRSPVGRTRTAPRPGARVKELTFAFASCQAWPDGFYTAYRRMNEQDLDLVIHLGDYIYEYATGGFAAAGDVIRPHEPANETVTLTDYRIRHGQYKTDPDLQALHSTVPWVLTWDDHEIANDAWSGGAENHDPATEGDYATRKAAAHKAYYEWMPVRAGASGEIYRRVRFGRLAELSMLDLRSYRSQQTSGTGVDDPARTITGDDQMAWLKDGLTSSTARWKLVGNSVMISRLDVATLPAWLLGPLAKLLGIPSNGFAVNNDQWDGYNADRDELVAHLRAHNTRDVVFLTGDIHTSWANELVTRTTVTDPAAAEFVVPSVTSDNVNDFIGVPAGIVGPVGAGLVRSLNPHVKWAELDNHGYGVLDLTPTRARMDWYHLRDRTSPTTSARWAAGWSVAAGSARLRKESGPLAV